MRQGGLAKTRVSHSSRPRSHADLRRYDHVVSETTPVDKARQSICAASLLDDHSNDHCRTPQVDVLERQLRDENEDTEAHALRLPDVSWYCLRRRSIAAPRRPCRAPQHPNRRGHGQDDLRRRQRNGGARPYGRAALDEQRRGIDIADLRRIRSSPRPRVFRCRCAPAVCQPWRIELRLVRPGSGTHA